MHKLITRTFIILFLLSAVLAIGVILTQSKAQASDTDSVYLPLVLEPFHQYLPIISYTLPPDTWLGPDGGRIVGLIIDPSNPSIMYVGSWGAGVFKSIDGGATWAQCNQGLTILQINALAIDPANPSILYAGPYQDKMYKSTDGCQTWKSAGSGSLPNQTIVYAIAVDPQNDNNVYIGTRGIPSTGSNNVTNWNGVLFKSTNGGADWSPSLTNIGGSTINDWVYSIAIKPGSPNTVFAASHEHGPYRTTNGGASWASSNNSPAIDGSGRVVRIDPQNPDTIYYGVWHRVGVYKSTQNGDTNTWKEISSGLGEAKIYDLFIDPLQTLTVYAATVNNYGVMKTTSGGSSWFSTGLQFDYIYRLAVNPVSSQTVFAGTSNDGVYASNNGGSSWFHSQKGLTNSWTSSLIVQPGNSQSLFTSISGAGVSRSSDRGATWSDFSAGLGDLVIHWVTYNLANPNQLFALTDTSGLYTLNLSSSSPWTRVGSGLPAPASVSIASAAPAYQPDNPFASYDALTMSPDDLQAELSAQAATATNAPLMTMVFARSNPAYAYMGTGGQGVFRSTSNGGNWSAFGLSGQTVSSLAVDPANPNLVYAATSLVGSVQVYNSSSWSSVSLPGLSVYSVATTPARPGMAYAGTSNGIYRGSGTGGWTQIGLSGVKVTAVAADPVRSNVIVAGAASGAYISRDGGATWQPGPPELNGYTIASITFDPNDSHWVYFTTTGNGNLVVYVQ
jgi:hypothetical protein